MTPVTPFNFLNKKSILLITLVGCVILLDQLTKFIIKKTMVLYDSIPLLGNFLQFTYIENSGMAFGIQIENRIVFTIISILATLIVAVYLFRLANENYLFKFSLSLILGGAIGNLIDRIVRGRVVDFIDVEFFDISLPQFDLWFIHFPGYSLSRWPIFNVADSAVTCGLILLTLVLFFQKDPVRGADNLSSERI
jgi:signal peptidase II